MFNFDPFKFRELEQGIVRAAEEACAIAATLDDVAIEREMRAIMYAAEHFCIVDDFGRRWTNALAAGDYDEALEIQLDLELREWTLYIDDGIWKAR